MNDTNSTTTAAEAVGQAAGEIQCYPLPGGGKGSANSSSPKSVSAQRWAITEASANWVPDDNRRTPNRAVVSVVFQLPSAEGGAALRAKAEAEFEARMDAIAREAEQLSELGDFRRAGERLAVAMTSVVEAGAKAKAAEGALAAYASGKPGDFGFDVLTADLDTAKAKLASSEGQLPTMRLAYQRREAQWIAASDALASQHRVRAFQDADAARVDAAALPLEEMLAAMMTVEHGRGMAGGIRGDQIRRHIKADLLPAPLPQMPRGKGGLVPAPWETGVGGVALVG